MAGRGGEKDGGSNGSGCGILVVFFMDGIFVGDDGSNMYSHLKFW